MEATAAIVSAIAAVVAGVFAGYEIWKRGQRLNEVLQWSCSVIAQLESLRLLTYLSPAFIDEKDALAKIRGIAIDLMILREHGHLYFRNDESTRHRMDRLPGYRGLRPGVLDPLKEAHEIAVAWPEASDETRLRLHLAADMQRAKFVSLIQKEVGRSRPASADLKKGGDRSDLARLIEDADPKRLQELRDQSALSAGRRVGLEPEWSRPAVAPLLES